MDNFEHVTNDLKDIFANTNYWLNFAELKNGMLVAINIACITGVTSTTYDIPFAFIVNLFFAISLIVSLCSYFPNISNIHGFFIFSDSKISKEQINLLFFGDIEQLVPEEYIRILCEKYYKQKIVSGQINKKVLDYAQEIIINSKLAKRKYQFFKIALAFTVLGFLFGIISCILKLLISLIL